MVGALEAALEVDSRGVGVVDDLVALAVVIVVTWTGIGPLMCALFVFHSSLFALVSQKR